MACTAWMLRLVVPAAGTQLLMCGWVAASERGAYRQMGTMMTCSGVRPQ